MTASAIAGKTGYLSGLSAEDRVAEHYARRGYPVDRRRFRGRGGEIDLVARDGDGLIFVEVKASRSHARAAERVTRRQIERIQAAAGEYLAAAARRLDTDMRFDVALVDGTGRIEIRENAFL